MKKKGEIRVPYGQAVYGKEEVAAVVRVLRDPNKLAPGERAAEFEKKVATLLGKKHGVMVNSGSSANLMAIESLGLPAGSEVITPVLTFGTTVAPLIQKGLVPVFVDVTEGTYLIDVEQVTRAISRKTKAIMVPSLLGNLPDLIALRKIAKEHSLFLIEDSCDTIGSTFAGKPTGFYTDITTTSFYASHIITAGATGGMVAFHDNALAERARVFSAWGRQSSLFGAHERSEDIAKRFGGRIEGRTYDAKFIFSEVGYNFQSTEMSAAFGLEQLKRLPEFTRRRRARFTQLLEFAKRYERFFILPRQDSRAKTNWLAFPLTIREGAPFSRLDITRYLEEHNIQTRPIFTGTITRQPGYRHIRSRSAQKTFPVSDHVMRNGFLIGAHHGLTDKQMDHLLGTMRTFLAKY